MRIVFAGTRDIAVPALRILLGRAPGRGEVIGVFTQPDRPAGRSKAPVPSPVKEIAEAARVPVWQPESLRDDAAVEALRDLAPDLGVVASYAQMLPRRVLRIPPAGWLNIHPSLLPRHRGPSPVAAAILAGDPTTGVTIIKLVSAMDAGPIVDQVHVVIRPADTAGSLTARLGDVGAERLATVVGDWVAGRLEARAQDESAATYSRLLTRQDGRLDWTLPAGDLARRVRAFDPWPGSFTFWQGRRLTVRDVAPLSTPQAYSAGVVVGEGTVHGRPAILVSAGDGALALGRLQLEGRKELDSAAFLRGQPAFLGAQLG